MHKADTIIYALFSLCFFALSFCLYLLTSVAGFFEILCILSILAGVVFLAIAMIKFFVEKDS